MAETQREQLTDFMTDAACRGATDMFIPPTGEYGVPRSQVARTWSPKAAKVFCAGCPVIVECADWALRVNPVAGVWAGVNWGNAKEKRRVRGGP